MICKFAEFIFNNYLIEKTKQDSKILISDNVEEKAITALDLPKRIISALQSAEIDTIAKLVAKNEVDLLNIKKFGLASLKIVKTKLAKLKLKLA